MFISFFSTFGQISSFDGINIQGQFKSNETGEEGVIFVLLDLDRDTIWSERHEDIVINELNTFDIVLGSGFRFGGSVDNFKDINWEFVDAVELDLL